MNIEQGLSRRANIYVGWLVVTVGYVAIVLGMKVLITM